MGGTIALILSIPPQLASSQGDNLYIIFAESSDPYTLYLIMLYLVLA